MPRAGFPSISILIPGAAREGVSPKWTLLKARLTRIWSQLELVRPTRFVLSVEIIVRLSDLQRIHHYFRSLLGREMEILVESSTQGRLQGTSGRYVPVECAGSESLLGKLVPVIAGKICEDRVLASCTGHPG